MDVHVHSQKMNMEHIVINKYQLQAVGLSTAWAPKLRQP